MAVHSIHNPDREAHFNLAQASLARKHRQQEKVQLEEQTSNSSPADEGGAVKNQESSGSNDKNNTSLPYNGDLQKAMRKQDRPAIRILMQHQQKQQEKEQKQNSERTTEQPPAKW